MKKSLRCATLCSALGSLLFSAALVRAVPTTDFTFTGAGPTTNWSDTDNWSPTGGPPASGQNAVFDSAAAIASLSGTSYEIANLTMSDGFIGESGKLTATGSSTFSGGNLGGDVEFIFGTSGNSTTGLTWTGGTLGLEPVVVVPAFASLATAPTPITTGKTVIESGASFNIEDGSYKDLLYHTLENNGSTFQYSSFDVSNAIINNTGLWTFNTSGAYIYEDPYSTDDDSIFNNTGSVVVSNYGETGIYSYFNNEGSLSVIDGTFVLLGGGNFSHTSQTQLSSIEGTPTLTFYGGTYDFQGDMSQYSTLTGDYNSVVNLIDSTVNMYGLMSTDGEVYLGANSVLNLGLVPTGGYHYIEYIFIGSSAFGPIEGSYTAPELTGLGGTIIGSGVWEEGTISGAVENGPVMIGSEEYYYGGFYLETANQKTLQNRQLMNNAYVDHYEGDLLLDNGHISNYESWWMSDMASVSVSENGGSITNFGTFGIYPTNYYEYTTFEVVPAITEAVIGANFTNSGVVYVETDTRFTGDYVQQMGETNINEDPYYYGPSTYLYNDAIVTFEKGATFYDGEIVGQGTIVGDITGYKIEIEPLNDSYAEYSVASFAGTGGHLLFDGNVTLNSDSAIVFKVYGSGEGEYDQISTTGTFNIGGATLYIDGPDEIASILTSSDYFPIMEALDGGQFIGMFAGLSDGGLIQVFNFEGNLIGQFNIFYDNFEIALTNFEAVPEPETWALLILGLGAVAWSLRRRRA